MPLLMAAPALATTISNSTFVDASSSGFDDIGPTGSVSGSAASLTSSGAGGFGLRYEAVVGVTLVFTFTASAATLDAPAGLVYGDEAALRMGRDSSLSSFTADDYPGAGGRSLAADGLFVTAYLPPPASLPEPRAEALLALALIALGWFDRVQRRRKPGS